MEQRARAKGGRTSGSSERRLRASRPAAVLMVLGVTLGTALPSGAYERPFSTDRLDLSTTGEPSSRGWASSSSISGTGRFVAFDHSADNLVSGDLNGQTDVFIRDLRSGKTELISATDNGLPAAGLGGIQAPGSTAWGGVDPYLSYDPSISSSGRYVAFSSYALNLVPGDTNVSADIFVFDRRRKSMERVSVASDGAQSEGLLGSFLPSISGNGRFVSFTSGAPNLVEEDTNAYPDVFVHDRKTSETTRVSVRSDGGESSGAPCFVPVPDQTVEDVLEDACATLFGTDWMVSSLSGDGRRVVFDSPAGDLVDNDANQAWDVFVHERKTRKTQLVSVDGRGNAAQIGPLSARFNDPCSRWGSSLTGDGKRAPGGHSISADGRFVVFASNASDLVPNDSSHPRATVCFSGQGGTDIFVRDLKTRRTERVSVESDGRQIFVNEPITTIHGAGGQATTPSISRDGDSVVFFVFCTSCNTTDGTGYWNHPDTGHYRGTMATFHRPTGAVAAGDAIPHDEEDKSFSFWQEYADISADGRYVSLRSNVLGQRASFGGLGGERSFVRWDWGADVGAFDIGGDKTEVGEPPDDRICIDPQICIPPGTAVIADEESLGRSIVPAPADLIGLSVAYRPQFGDLLVIEEVEALPSLAPTAYGTHKAVEQPLIYGLRFGKGERRYEVRASSFDGGTFALFDCSTSQLGPCEKTADLNGGYGTTGHRVAFSLPLDEIGLQQGGKLFDVEAFVGAGTLRGGTAHTLDAIRF